LLIINLRTGELELDEIGSRDTDVVCAPTYLSLGWGKYRYRSYTVGEFL